MATKFALYFGNRGFFPESLIAAAREEVTGRLQELGFETLNQPAGITRYDAVETAAEGRAYAKFLAEHRGEYDGVILCLPNFGDENGASEALRDCGTPIYILAFPDEFDKMDFTLRRDAFCGKFSVMDVFTQFDISFTAWPPHTLSPSNPVFAEEMRQFGAVCRIVKKLKRCRLGAIGARPTLFKTIRFDETAMQKYGITTEVFDNSDLLVRVEKLRDDAPELKQKIERFLNYTDFSAVPADKVKTLAKIAVALDQFIDEYELDALGLRCWSDLQETLKISPCVILSELNDRNFPAACELDMGNAVSMLALQAASEAPATCLDWNNNYENDPDKCILFHCGPVPQSLMTAKGKIVDHPMFAKALGSGCGYGCNVGFIRPMDFTFASTTTKNGRICYYSGNGKFTGEPLGEGFFGCGGVAEIKDLQKKLVVIGYSGYRHHVSVASGNYQRAIDEAFTRYLKYDHTEL
ncbi:hypothetical protein [uncultured Victivallis sp.]|uniref:L-fucose/L-arabinose isomerase family protein n=1 Tax=uncultured Victivallis sp. TaxID=354118 RepID=UPI002595A2E4|nr:hypothetical protein [uncultured Victivallis sp.]